MAGDAVHNVLAAACKAIGVEAERYARGPKPELYNRTYVALALWIAERGTELVDGARRKEHVELMGWARRVLDGEALSKAELKELRQRFPMVQHGLASGREVDPASPLALGEGAALEALLCAERDVSGKGARPAAIAAAKRLGPPFLDELAAEIVRLEVVTLVERQELDTGGAAIAAALWRGTTGAKATHFVVRLGDERYALLGKTKGRWTWSAGERDDVLATVPDALMESAVATVVGGRGAPAVEAAVAAPRAELARIEDGASLAGVALDADGRGWIAFGNGRVGSWEAGAAEVRLSEARVGRIAGVVAGPRGVAVTWGAALTRWEGLIPTELGGAADGALFTGDGRLVWWRGEEIAIDKKRLEGMPRQRVLIDRVNRRLIAVSPSGVRLFGLDGTPGHRLPLSADGAALSPDGARLAVWTTGEKARKVVVADAREGGELFALTVDKGHIDGVVFALDKIVVRYHAEKRVAVFDERGRALHRLQAKDLGSRGSAVEALFPLAGGDVLAFAPYPRGETLLVGWDARLVGQWKLERFYVGGSSALADDGTCVLFGHSKDGTRLLRLTRG